MGDFEAFLCLFWGLIRRPDGRSLCGMAKSFLRRCVDCNLLSVDPQLCFGMSPNGLGTHGTSAKPDYRKEIEALEAEGSAQAEARSGHEEGTFHCN